MSETSLPRRAGFGMLLTALLFACLANGPAAAQTVQAPGVDWRRNDWFPVFPPLSTSPQIQTDSGEDWWNNHSNSYDPNTHELQGYIAAGFSTFQNYEPKEPDPGCLVSLQLSSPNCGEFEAPGHVPGFPLATMALIDKTGNSPQWFNAYAEGEFFRVIQTSDGGYLATGYTASTRTLDGTKPIYYNPGQAPSEVTDSFSRGNGCPKIGGDAQVHATLVKTDRNGVVEWQYLYGIQPYRSNSVPDPDDAYSLLGRGWGIVEAANGNFLMVGEVGDPDANYFCSGHFHQLTRAFLIEVTPQGLWVSWRYLEPTATLPTNALGIAKYQDPGGAFHYVISGTSFFQTGPPGQDCGHQKVFAQQLDDTPSRAQEWDVTDFNISSPKFQTSNQNTYDVEIANYSTYSGTGYINHTDILLPMVVDCAGCLFSGSNSGTGMVYRLTSYKNPNMKGGTQIGTAAQLPSTKIQPPQLHAFDLRMRVTPTPDGGFAAVSTVRSTYPADTTSDPPYPSGCGGQFDFKDTWNTDAYVARFDASNAMLWELPFPNVEPPKQTVWPSDWKFKECVYSISQSQDGGFVVSGNGSYNFDDDYMAKLKPESPQTGPGDHDLLIRDTPLDSGLEPNPDTGPMWVSNDIWVRNGTDCSSTVPQNPVYGLTNTVCVRVTNIDATAAKTGTLKVYWAKASTGLGWPTQWNQNKDSSGLLFGDQIPGSWTVTVPANGSMIVPVPWPTVPNPADFAAFGGEQSHFCLLARIETAGGMTYPETTDVYFNTRNNAKIAWKNVSVDSTVHKTQQFVTVRNIEAQPALLRLGFSVSKTGPQTLTTLLDYGTVDVLLGDVLFDRWVRGGSVGRGVKLLRGRRLRLVSPNASIGNLRMGPGEMATISTLIDPRSLPASTPEVDLDVVQYSTVGRREKLVGGQRFALMAPPRCGGDLRLPVESDTQHWQVTEVPPALTGVPAIPYPPYAAPGSIFGSPANDWITAANSSFAEGPGGFYTYQYQFCLCEGFSNPALHLNLTTDNEATVQLNGSSPIGTTPPDLTPTTIATGPAQAALFRAGTNVLTIRVRNRGVGGDPTQFTPTGLSANGTLTATSGRCPAGGS